MSASRPQVILAFVVAVAMALVASGTAQEKPTPEVRTGSLVYREDPKRKLVIYYPDGWQASDKRAALVIIRCRIPEQREFFRRRGMVVIKPQTAPVNSGQLPKLDLDVIAGLPKPRDQVADTRSSIRFIRANAAKLGVDPEKIVAAGASGGGDLALQAHLNRSFDHADDDLEVSSSPDALVLYCPAFDGIDIWFVKNATLLERTRAEAPAFVPLLERFVENTTDDYAQPLDHRASLIELAAELGREKGIAAAEVEAFQSILGLFNERDWQLLHPVEDALKMSASRILTSDPLPPTIILLGDRDHLREHQLAFVENARAEEQTFELKVYEGGGHSFLTMPAFQETSTRDVERFLVGTGMLAEE